MNWLKQENGRVTFSHAIILRNEETLKYDDEDEGVLEGPTLGCPGMDCDLYTAASGHWKRKQRQHDVSQFFLHFREAKSVAASSVSANSRVSRNWWSGQRKPFNQRRYFLHPALSGLEVNLVFRKCSSNMLARPGIFLSSDASSYAISVQVLWTHFWNSIESFSIMPAFLVHVWNII